MSSAFEKESSPQSQNGRPCPIEVAPPHLFAARIKAVDVSPD
jgi:hypothetical protein